jgi:hypothetical protein
MFDPAATTVGQIGSTLRDFSIFGALMSGLVVTVWKGRGIYDAVTGFFSRIIRHMDIMERGMNTLLTNHLFHIEADLRHLTGRPFRASVVEETVYEEEQDKFDSKF